MTKWWTAALLALPLAACGSSPDDDPMTPASENERSASASDAGPLPRELLEQWILANYATYGKLGYLSSEYDLDGDGKPEVLAYIGGTTLCGTGGCALVVAKREGEALTKVLQTSVTRLPVGVLDSSTNGWRDLWVSTAGGGELSGRRILRYDGDNYPSNPTVPPAEELKVLDAQILIEDTELDWLN
ncbi:hypothetical protein [Tsuneonella sp. HG222]